MSLYEKFKDKIIDVNYETGYHFQITYQDDSHLSWKAVSKVTEDQLMEESETYTYYEIKPDIYFVSWIEHSGLTVSQILDFTNNTVYAFMTWHDDTVDSKRAHLLHKGTITIL